MTGKIFINYRRGDDPGNTGRLFDQLEDVFPRKQLFMDVDSIPPGRDFARVIEEQVAQCDVLLAVIGKGWLDARDDQGVRRLDKPDDFVRIEIESALKQDKLVIPVLVHEARMPTADELPEAIRHLATRNAVRLTHERFKSDTQGLIRAIQQALEHVSALRGAQDGSARKAVAEQQRRRDEEAVRQRAQVQREADVRARQEKEQARLKSIVGLSPEKASERERRETEAWTTASDAGDAAARARIPGRTGAPRRRQLLLGSLAGVAIGLAAVYGITTFLGNRASDAQCAPAVATAGRVAPLARGEVAGVVVASRPLQLPDLAFRDASGSERHLAEWRGRTVLLNLWATWCIPCRKEMPALDELQAKLGGPPFEVVAINIDTRDANKPRAWLKEVGIARLDYYTDASAKVFQDLKLVGRAIGMPTTILVNPAGCEIGTIAGPAEWASEDALALVRASLKQLQ
jgi:thiol-disulfide isomerase/thioredoxin